MCDNLSKAQVNFRRASDTVMCVYSSSPDIAAVKVFSLVPDLMLKGMCDECVSEGEEERNQSGGFEPCFPGKCTTTVLFDVWMPSQGSQGRSPSRCSPLRPVILVWG